MITTSLGLLSSIWDEGVPRQRIWYTFLFFNPIEFRLHHGQKTGMQKCQDPYLHLALSTFDTSKTTLLVYF